MLFSTLSPRSRLLVTAHRCANLGNGRTGAVGGSSGCVVAILEAAEFYDTGVGSLWGYTLGRGFFEALHVDQLDEPGPWIIEVAVVGEPAGSGDWSHLEVKDIRRPVDEELLDGMYGRGGWEVV